MTRSEQRVELIGATILEQARQESEAIRAAARQAHTAALDGFRDQVIDRMYGKIQAQGAAIRQECARIRAVARRDAHRQLLLRRQELADRVLEAVGARLREYAQTPAYREELLAQIRELTPPYDHAYSTVTLSPADEAMIPEIRALLGESCAIRCDASVKLGGFTLLNSQAAVLVNRTLEEALRRERNGFLLRCGLKVV